MLKIGEFSKLSRVSIRMLRYYDDNGLLKPAETDVFTGYRYYSEEQLMTAGRIAAYRDMGFGITDIGKMLSCYEDKATMESFFSQRRTELARQAEQTAWRLKLLDTAEERLRKDIKAMKYDVTLKNLPERYAATVRMTIPNYENEGMLWDVLVRETMPLNIKPDDPCLCSVIFHDGEYKETDVDVEAQKTVKGTYPDTEHVKFKMVPPVTFASATYKGSYSLIGEVNAAVAQWIEGNGFEYDGPSFNIYHVSPHETSNPDEFVTEVCYPVKGKITK